MQDLTKKLAFRCILVIVDYNMRDRLTEFLADSKMPVYFQMHGVGTVRSDILTLFGLGDPHKSITVCFVPQERTELLLAEMNQALRLHKKGTGIAISIPIGSMQGWLYKLLNADIAERAQDLSERERKKMSETITHAMIMVTMSQGFSDDVMSTARNAGATGGTILRGLKCNSDEAGRRFGIPIQEEQEILLIVVPKEKRMEIMSAISQNHGIASPAHGVALSLPVDAIMGL